ncbi:MAG: hypothetical protein DBY05_01550 [Clostridiales bacterium]|nr:MAG: hypothetical protein DBY05_01550 [Clostridiales bacterium]
MKKFTILLAALLCGLLILGSCSNGKKEGFRHDIPAEAEGGIHVHNVTETPSSYLLKEGVTEYSVLLPAAADSNTLMAETELNALFEEATGTEFPVVTDTGDVPGGKYISIGSTSLLEEVGLHADRELLGGYGFHIATIGENLFLYGATGYANAYAVYELLADILDFEFFYTDTYRLNANVRDIKLKRYDVTEVPDIEYRAANYGYMRENVETQMRMRVTPYEDFFMLVDGKVAHNSLNILPPDKFTEHKDYWYEKDFKQLCYTAHGVKSEYEAMVEAASRKLLQVLQEYPDRNLVTITTSDDGAVCECASCRESKLKYGADSAAVILFINDVRAHLDGLLALEENKQYNRDFDILFFAYSSYEEAPSTKNPETGRYEANNGIQCADGVSVWMAPIKADFTHKMTASENLTTREQTDAWRAISDTIYLWYYSTNFKHYLTPYDTFDAMPDTYRYMKDMDAQMIFNQAQYDNSASATGFSMLKGYLNAKLAWNVNEDYAKLIDDYFETCYGDAAPVMSRLFNALRTHTTLMKERNYGYDGVFSVYNDYEKSEMWPKQLLLSWKDYIDQALFALEGIKNISPEIYEKQYRQVVTERIWMDYLLVQLYESTTSDSEVNALKTEFVGDYTLSGMNKYIESHDISELYKQWGI